MSAGFWAGHGWRDYYREYAPVRLASILALLALAACAQPQPRPRIQMVDSGWTTATPAPGFDAGSGALR